MPTFQNHPVLASSNVATAPSPATSGTSVAVASGDGAKFGTAPFQVAIWPAGAEQTLSNCELATCTARSTDTLTITRAQEGTTARSVTVGDQIAAVITPKHFTDLETAINAAGGGGATPDTYGEVSINYGLNIATTGGYLNKAGSPSVVFFAGLSVSPLGSGDKVYLGGYGPYPTNMSALWDKPFWAKHLVTQLPSPTSDTKFYLRGGALSASNSPTAVKAAQFCIQASTAFYASTTDGTSETKTDISGVMTFGSNTMMDLVSVHTPATNQKFYHNGSLQATHTTNLPSGAASSTQGLFSMYIEAVAANSQVFRVLSSKANWTY